MVVGRGQSPPYTLPRQRCPWIGPWTHEQVIIEIYRINERLDIYVFQWAYYTRWNKESLFDTNRNYFNVLFKQDLNSYNFSYFIPIASHTERLFYRPKNIATNWGVFFFVKKTRSKFCWMSRIKKLLKFVILMKGILNCQK